MSEEKAAESEDSSTWALECLENIPGLLKKFDDFNYILVFQLI